MSRPGWYPDPYGTGSLRWWDGRTWTDNLNPEPSRPARPQPAPPRPAPEPIPARPAPPARPPQAAAAPYRTAPHAGPRQPPALPVAARLRGRHLHADEQAVSYGDTSLAWPHVEWVAYWAAQHPAGYGHGEGIQWIFQVGRFPFHGGPRIEIVIELAAFEGQGPPDDPEHLWLRLVELCRDRAERRLVAEMAGRVQAGESIDVAQGLTLHPGGVRGNRVSLSWSAISGGTVEGGRIWIQQSSGSSPVLYVPQQNPNAILIPALLAALKR